MHSAGSGYTLQQRLGLLRSLLIYYGNPAKTRRMVRFYAQFLQPGELAFDVGAHVGDRLRVWSKLGARTVAIEPQPLLMRFLRDWYGRNPDIVLVEQAVGAHAGTESMLISAWNPTVSTLSQAWAVQVKQADSFASVEWNLTTQVEVTTLDALIERYGVPAFCKIDVEGFELEVLRGLTYPLPALSFEHIPAAPGVAQGCLEQLDSLAAYEYNWSRGERHQWESALWLGPEEMVAQLRQMPPNGASGDVYARAK